MITMESTGRLTHQRRRTRLLAVVGSALAAVAVWAVAEFGLGINVREPAGDVGAANVVFASVVASLAGWALLALLERVTARAARWWPAIATTVALLSLVAPLTMPRCHDVKPRRARAAAPGCRSDPDPAAVAHREGKQPMSAFSAAELHYLRTERLLGRLATVDPSGQPHVVPVGWRYNPELDTIDIGGRDFARTRKFRNVARNPRVAFVVDDVLPPWQPRCVQIRGHADALQAISSTEGQPPAPIIRITPTKVVSWGLGP